MALVSEFALPRQIHFEANYENGNMTDWDAVEHQASAPDPVAQTVFVKTGSYAQKSLTNGVGNYRSEASNDTRRWLQYRDGAERYFGFSVWLQSPWPNLPFMILSQWHQTTTVSSPQVCFEASSSSFGIPGNFTIRGGPNNTDGFPTWYSDCGPVITDAWVDVVVWIRFSTTTGGGRVKVWINDVLKTDYTPPSSPTIWPSAGYAYFKAGMYRDATGSTNYTVFHDNYRVGGTYESVAPSTVQMLVKNR